MKRKICANAIGLENNPKGQSITKPRLSYIQPDSKPCDPPMVTSYRNEILIIWLYYGGKKSEENPNPMSKRPIKGVKVFSIPF
jgi:hypothetical protein